MRKGRTQIQSPVYISDLKAGEFASSGFRGHIRFLRSGNSIGAYSLSPGVRSKILNRGAIIKIEDSGISYLASAVSSREDATPDSKDLKHGPLLPHSANPTNSGTISVTASLETATTQSREAVDKVMLERSGGL
jgi:hypothetical protein